MGFFERFKKRLAIKSYARLLPRLLAKDYGRSKSYTPAQVRSSIERHGLNTEYSCYGIAMFSDREGFDQFHAASGELCNYDEMRGEISNDHFGGNVDFSEHDVASGSHWDGGHGSHDLGGHHSSGFGDGGGD
jgi:hypothetical protein